MSKAKKSVQKVTVKYVSKKTGKVKTYTYHYKKDTAGKRIKVRRSQFIGEKIKIVSKSGKVNEKVLERLQKDASITERSVMGEKIHNWKKDHKGEALSLKTFKAMVATDAITRALYNAGYSVIEAADELGVSVNDILNQSNWVNGDFVVSDTGERYELNFTYDGGGAFILVN